MCNGKIVNIIEAIAENAFSSKKKHTVWIFRM